MRLWLPVACVAGSLLAASALAGEDVSECAKIRGAARYGALGYDHFVQVDNQCQRAVSCQVWTNVDPEPHHALQVEPGQVGEVKTRSGSPAREFEAQGVCRFQ